jgi:hypothetical protein
VDPRWRVAPPSSHHQIRDSATAEETSSPPLRRLPFYGYRLHAAVCARTDLPVAWRTETAASNESNYVAPLLDRVKARGFEPATVALDMGYDNGRVYEECKERGVRPIIPLRETPAVKAGRAGPPTCEHGV